MRKVCSAVFRLIPFPSRLFFFAYFTVCHGFSCVDDQSARGVKYKLNFSGNLYRRTSHSVGKLLSFVFVLVFVCLLVIILYAFLSYDVLGSLACLFLCVCVFVCTPARANLWKCLLEAVRSFLLPSVLFNFCPLLLHGVRYYSLSL